MLNIIQHDTIHELQLARPPANALNTELLTLLRDAVLNAPNNGAEGLVISSAGTMFSGGMDVPHLMSLDHEGLKTAWSRLFECVCALTNSSIPIVAAINGHNPAGGCVLALCCDYRLMVDGPYKIGLNEVQVGLTVPDCIQALMRRVVGHYRAERLLVSGSMVDANTAHRIGLVDELTTADELKPRAIQWLQDLLKLPRQPMLQTRRLARADIMREVNAFNESDLDAFLQSWNSDDTQKALQALMAKLKK
jgi:enoyl-CoA hydratase/carnithine racemase